MSQQSVSAAAAVKHTSKRDGREVHVSRFSITRAEYAADSYSGGNWSMIGDLVLSWRASKAFTVGQGVFQFLGKRPAMTSHGRTLDARAPRALSDRGRETS